MTLQAANDGQTKANVRKILHGWRRIVHGAALFVTVMTRTPAAVSGQRTESAAKMLHG